LAPTAPLVPPVVVVDSLWAGNTAGDRAARGAQIVAKSRQASSYAAGGCGKENRIYS